MKCEFMFSCTFRWFALKSATQHTKNKTPQEQTFDKQHQHHDEYADTQNKDIMIHRRMTKIIITIAMMLEKRSHFKKKKKFYKL